MKVRKPYLIPIDKERQLDYLVKLEWWNLGFRISIIAVLGLVLGSSQAMKAAWIEDILSLIPPVAFLIAMHFRNRPPNGTFPYGYQRATVIAFLCAATALSLMGSLLLLDSLIKLISQEHPSVGAITLFGHTFWMGWLMIAALIYSVIPPMVIGRLQTKAAIQIHEKTVYVDGKMSKADWMTGLAAIVGIIGIGAGIWWADALAAAMIAIDVTKDGFINLKEAVGDLLDRRPRFTAETKPEHLAETLEIALKQYEWVADAAVRLREEGHVFSGEAFITPRHTHQLTEHLAAAEALLNHYDWRIYEVVVSVTTNAHTA
ncbi:cation transporter [Halomonas sp. DWK9]|uniref:cation transporter n=1 Tax=Halomonas sp. DWK9 TaxID=3060155 RepID=UPI00287F5852|nr:cation transporter [Halomonas sp. DWK9]